MKPIECELEAEVLTAVLQSRWPDHVDAELRAHVAGCAICADVAAVAGAIEDDREQTRTNAVLPDSGRVWWLAQMRARREAGSAAARPITAVQVIAFACAMALMGACFGAILAGARIPRLLPSATAIVAGHGLLVLATAAFLLLVPAAVYLALRD